MKKPVSRACSSSGRDATVPLRLPLSGSCLTNFTYRCRPWRRPPAAATSAPKSGSGLRKTPDDLVQSDVSGRGAAGLPACRTYRACGAAVRHSPLTMHVNKTGLSGLLLIEPRSFRDERGFFLESFHEKRYRDHGIADTFVQENHSRSRQGVLRGLHFQVRRPQAQIVTVTRGRIFDVAVDLRADSATFGRWFGAELSDEGPRQLYMAPGFAHGFCVLSEFADLLYKVSQMYDPADEGGLLWSDPDIGVRWPIHSPLVSARDAAYPRLRELTRARLPHVETAGGEGR